jgi:hypothetical protein
MNRCGTLAAVDFSTLTIGKVRGEWAYQQTGKCGKMHTCLHLAGEQSAFPAATVLSTAVGADLDEEVLDQLVKDRRYTYLFDRGYIHYSQFLAWKRKGVQLAVRLTQQARTDQFNPGFPAYLAQQAGTDQFNPGFPAYLAQQAGTEQFSPRFPTYFSLFC